VTESAGLGPFDAEGGPERGAGRNLAPRDSGGTPMRVSGRVRDLGGRPIAGAKLGVWQADSSGLYDSQYVDGGELHMRRVFHTDDEGRYLVRTVRPVYYAIPHDGPVGRMLRAAGRHPWR